MKSCVSYIVFNDLMNDIYKKCDYLNKTFDDKEIENDKKLSQLFKFVLFKAKKIKKDDKFSNAEFMIIINKINDYLINKAKNKIFVTLDEYFKFVLEFMFDDLKDIKNVYENLKKSRDDTEFYAFAHDELYKYGILTEQLDNESDDIGNITRLLNDFDFVEDQDYIKITKNKNSEYLRNVHYKESKSNRKTTYYMSSFCFRQILMQSRNTNIYRKYFAILEDVYFAYNNYTLFIKNYINKNQEIKFNELVGEYNELVDEIDEKDEEIKRKNDVLNYVTSEFEELCEKHNELKEDCTELNEKNTSLRLELYEMLENEEANNECNNFEYNDYDEDKSDEDD